MYIISASPGVWTISIEITTLEAYNGKKNKI